MKNHRVGGNLSDTEITPYSFLALNQVSQKTEGVRMHGLALSANAHQLPCAPFGFGNQSLINGVNESGIWWCTTAVGGTVPDVGMTYSTVINAYSSQTASCNRNVTPFVVAATINRETIKTIKSMKQFLLIFIFLLTSVNLMAQTLYVTSGGTVVSQNTAVDIAGNATVSTGATALVGATVSISSNFVTGQDVLGLNGAASGGITSSYNSTTGILTLSGSASAADYQTTLRKVTYTNTSASPTTSARVITFSLNSALPFTGNGHYFEFISSTDISWTDANTAANTKTYFGLQGYLATITSLAENTFVYSKINAAGWLGGSDAASEGVWKWVSGPETGTQFWSGGVGGSAFGGNFAYWHSGQPDNAGSAEHYLDFWNGDQWNDYPNTASGSIAGYVVEYGGMTGDPVLHISDNVVVTIPMTYPGNALDFDGVNDYVSINDAANLNPGTQNLTVECWFNATTTGSGEHHLYNKENLYEASIIDGYFRFALMPNWVWQGGNSFPVTPGQWYHIAVVYDHTNITIYKNGLLFSTLAKTNDIGTTTTKLLIGARGDNTPTAYFNGKIDELRVWNTARTACEINSNMANSLVGNETGLVALYNFDQGTASSSNSGITTLTDFAGGDNTGTLTNMSLSGTTSNWVSSQAGLGLPVVTTTGSANVSAVAADISGNITAIGSGNATVRGVCYNTTGCPTVNNPKSETSGSYSTGVFTIGLTGLTGSTTYYARAYAINASGTSYGTQLSFTTLGVPANPSSISYTYNIICNGAGTQLTANGAVGTVYWYTGSCEGTQVTTGNPVTVTPTTSTTYYARNSNNGAFSSGCVSTAITVNPRPTVAQLQATGTGIKWYLTETGGTALATTTLLLNNTHYYASQTVNGVESTARLDVLVSMTNP